MSSQELFTGAARAQMFQEGAAPAPAPASPVAPVVLAPAASAWSGLKGSAADTDDGAPDVPVSDVPAATEVVEPERSVSALLDELIPQGPAAGQPEPVAGQEVARVEAPTAGLDVEPAPVPSGREMLLPAASPVETMAQWGWAARLNALTGGAAKRTPGRVEAEYRQRMHRVRQAGWTRPVRVMVANPVGVGKTVTTLCLANALGVARGGAVVAWEACEAVGSLHGRSETSATAMGLGALVADAASVTSGGIFGGYVTNQTSGVDVLASPTQRPPLDAAAVGDVTTILDRCGYRIEVADTGENLHAPAFGAVADLADALVVPISWSSPASVIGAIDTLEWMAAHGRGDLAANPLIVVVNDGRRADPQVKANTAAYIAKHWENLVVEIPFDVHVAMGLAITWAALSRASIIAWAQVADAVIARLGQVRP